MRIDYRGLDLMLTHEPYGENGHYRAHATDMSGNEYVVQWEVINPEASIEDELCDWSEYTVTKL